MRSNFPQRYEVASNILDFDRNKDRLEVNFKAARTIKQKNALLLDNCQYAYFYTNPSALTMKQLGFRFREFYRRMGGDTPAHVQDCIIKADPRYTARFDKLTEEQQLYVATNNPWVVYGWRNLFDASVLARVNPLYESILQSMELLGVDKEKFNETFLNLHRNRDSLDVAANAITDPTITF